MKTQLFIPIVFLFTSFLCHGEIKLPAMIGSNMVLQQENNVNLWGWSDQKNITVKVSWNKDKFKTTTQNGKWNLTIPTPKGNFQSQTITISDGQAITLNNILIGEVWICSGQSNMEMPLKGNMGQPVEHSLDQMMQAPLLANQIRFITVPRTDKDVERETFEKGQWETTSVKNVPGCSAVAYFFAKQLTLQLHVPVGLVINSWGGSTIEAWMNESTLKKVKNADIQKAKADKSFHHRLQTLYNTMLHPIINYTAKGVIWYQGESNIHNYTLYASMMEEMVQLWREEFHNPQMPFYYVQIAPYKYDNSNDISAALLREQQAMACQKIPYSGMISTIDIGQENCIHPAKKEQVAQRLALLTLTNTYHEPFLTANGPQMTEVSFKQNKAIITFNNAPCGLIPLENNLEGFEIAGKDQHFYPAKANVIGRTVQVEVWSDQVEKPVAVRYAFRNYPGNLTLANSLGLPAFPFRTDKWDTIK